MKKETVKEVEKRKFGASKLPESLSRTPHLDVHFRNERLLFL